MLVGSSRYVRPLVILGAVIFTLLCTILGLVGALKGGILLSIWSTGWLITLAGVLAGASKHTWYSKLRSAYLALFLIPFLILAIDVPASPNKEFMFQLDVYVFASFHVLSFPLGPLVDLFTQFSFGGTSIFRRWILSYGRIGVYFYLVSEMVICLSLGYVQWFWLAKKYFKKYERSH